MSPRLEVQRDKERKKFFKCILKGAFLTPEYESFGKNLDH